MSDQEQDDAILRIVKLRSEAKKRRTLLESELTTAGQSLWEIGRSLKAISGPEFIGAAAAILPQIDKAPDICELNRIRTMLEELKKLEATLIQLKRSATDLGID
ncbi:MAG TPA: hypothetical protein VLA42_04715 [Verrucomicrobiae bacterium]|nr:hypothetical protein [Verrucomicrobiae bacterium]